jgi:hypothetical protein
MHVACTDIDGFFDPEYISSYFARPFFTTVSFLRDYLLFIFFTLRLLPLYTYSYPSSRLLVILTLSSFPFVADAVSALFLQLSCQFCIWWLCSACPSLTLLCCVICLVSSVQSSPRHTYPDTPRLAIHYAKRDFTPALLVR